MAISPLSIATDGYLCTSGTSLAIASNGYLCTVTVSPPIDPPTGDTGIDFIGGGGFGYSTPYFVKGDPWKNTGLKKLDKVKLITVTAIKDGIEYVEKKYTSDLTVDVKDVKFEMTDENNEIKIKIFFDK